MSFSYVHCAYCQKRFLKDNRHIKENLKINNNFYCSPLCQYNAKRKRIEVSCESLACNRKFLRTLSNISFHNFCSHTCSAKYSNSHRTRKKKNNSCLTCGLTIARRLKYCSHKC